MSSRLMQRSAVSRRLDGQAAQASRITRRTTPRASCGHSYRLATKVGIQPDNGAWLTDQAKDGFPQRIWLNSTTDPGHRGSGRRRCSRFWSRFPTSGPISRAAYPEVSSPTPPAATVEEPAVDLVVIPRHPQLPEDVDAHRPRWHCCKDQGLFFWGGGGAIRAPSSRSMKNPTLPQ